MTFALCETILARMNKRVPLEPDADLVQLYISRFDSDEGLVHADLAIKKLLAQFSRNTDLDEVWLKVVAVNQLYNTNIMATYNVAKHIQNLGVDSLLHQGDSSAVDIIAKVQIGSKVWRFYSFATKYCSFHAPDHYPIYDQYVDRLLNAYRRRNKFAMFSSQDLKNYSIFKDVLRQFQTHFGLQGFSSKQLDQFLWMYGRELFVQSTKK